MPSQIVNTAPVKVQTTFHLAVILHACLHDLEVIEQSSEMDDSSTTSASNSDVEETSTESIMN